MLGDLYFLMFICLFEGFVVGMLVLGVVTDNSLMALSFVMAIFNVRYICEALTRVKGHLRE